MNRNENKTNKTANKTDSLKNNLTETSNEENSADAADVFSSEQKAALFEMFALLAKTTDSSVISDFFACLMTPSELVDLATRWLLVKEIDTGTTQREIAKKFHISLCKITRGSKELKKDGSAFKKFIEMSKTDNDKQRK